VKFIWQRVENITTELQHHFNTKVWTPCFTSPLKLHSEKKHTHTQTIHNTDDVDANKLTIITYNSSVAVATAAAAVQGRKGKKSNDNLYSGVSDRSHFKAAVQR